MQIIEPSVELVDRVDALRIMRKLERIGRVCYNSEDKITDDSHIDFLRGVISRGHESVVEHESITVKFVTNRAITHEMVRHRLASYTQVSTRYVNYKNSDMEFCNPMIKVGSMLHKLWCDSMTEAESKYKDMIEIGAAPQIARGVLGNSLAATIFMTANIREWRHVFKLRCAPSAHPEIRLIMIPLLRQLHQLMPVLFEDLIHLKKHMPEYDVVEDTSKVQTLIARGECTTGTTCDIW